MAKNMDKTIFTLILVSTHLVLQFKLRSLIAFQDAIDDFNQRITHILNIHKNKLVNNLPWSELSAYIFGLEAQNEWANCKNL